MHAKLAPLAALMASLVLSGQASAQSPLEACQDQLRGIRVYAERLRSEKNASDLDAAQTIANLIKQVEALRAELEDSKRKAASVEPKKE